MIKENNLLLSIIVPVYNVEKYLDKCLKSIAYQTFQDFECILVDDGSTDHSGAICDDWVKNDSRFHCVHKANGGLSDARNCGISVAQGKYIAFVDSDDWIAVDMYEKMISRAERDQLEVALCGVMQYHNVTGKKNPRKELFPFGRENEIISWKTTDIFPALNNISAWNKLFLRDFIKKNNLYFITGTKYEDIPFWSRGFYLATRIGIIPEYLYYYRIGRSNSIVQGYDYRDLPRAYASKVAESKKYGGWSEIKDDVIAYFIMRMVYNFIRSRCRYRKEFFEDMRRLILSCGKYEMGSRHSLPVRIGVLFFSYFTVLPYSVWMFFFGPLFAVYSGARLWHRLLH